MTKCMTIRLPRQLTDCWRAEIYWYREQRGRPPDLIPGRTKMVLNATPLHGVVDPVLAEVLYLRLGRVVQRALDRAWRPVLEELPR